MDRANDVVARDATSCLHIILFSDTIFRIISLRRTSPRGCLRRWGECGSRGRDDTFRSRAAPGIRPAGIMTGLRLCRWTGTGGDGQRPSFSHVPGSASGAERRRWFASVSAVAERREVSGPRLGPRHARKRGRMATFVRVAWSYRMHLPAFRVLRFLPFLPVLSCPFFLARSFLPVRL
jgi:hypothetical protein